ncbi:hypothetical protein T440DRAFT_468400 [Plenodomus tracheiphilus IPT5]|uniref:WKF domain-containing protein n=1 Tax=Plenodomus tracheiphilus IPT5 TaxID=1408161 RepID=A0A6A7B4H7_9PLEO|nr:hypothetical protein T440DRAFT_468400 [Plenodomus tracheiphilus IPT5]
MSLDGQRVPAWRRLGLALKNEGQSGVAVPEPQAPHNIPELVSTYDASVETRDNHTSPIEPHVNEKPSRLGKRKHQPEPAEDADQTSKKSKTEPTEGKTNGAAAYDLPIVSETANVTIHAPSEKPTPSTTQPKGDPNYRKKKEKVPKRRKENAKPKATVPSPSEIAKPDAQPTLLASTETDHLAPSNIHKLSKKDKSRQESDSASPSQNDRRKSVAFTPDTKTSDGNSGQELFKKWVAEQKGTGDVSAPPAVSNFTLHSLIAEEEKAARKNGQLDKKTAAEEPPATASEAVEQKTPTSTQQAPAANKAAPPSAPSASTAKGKKKDPAVYIAYLTQYYSDRDNWKFNKAKQNDVVDNALSIFRIPHEHTEALSEYVAGLKGVGVIDRLRERCQTTLKELDEQDAQKPMDDVQARKVAEQEAEHERIIQERKRRRTDGDVEKFMHHPHGDGYIRRLQRKRAEALLTALGRAAPILPAVNQHTGINPMMKSVAPPQRDARKRKRRTDVSSDESSSDSSSDDDSSDSDSESDSDESKSNAASSSSSSDSGSSSDGDSSDGDSD